MERTVTSCRELDGWCSHKQKNDDGYNDERVSASVVVPVQCTHHGGQESSRALAVVRSSRRPLRCSSHVDVVATQWSVGGDTGSDCRLHGRLGRTADTRRLTVSDLWASTLQHCWRRHLGHYWWRCCGQVLYVLTHHCWSSPALSILQYCCYYRPAYT